jgi:NitT/TauT family transport system ATP-binding protein
MTNNPFLTINHLSHTFNGGPDVLDDISLTVESGAFVALVGPSGVGKSTLLRLMGGLIQPSSGDVHLTNGDAKSIGIVFQRDNLMPWRTAFENVQLPLEIKGVQDDEAHERVQSLLELVGLAGFEHSYPAQLSGGMAQRVALARGLVHQPKLLLLDEPFGALDALTRERMGQELLRIRQAMPVTVFMVTHSISEAVMLADEVLVMGRREESSTPATITHHIPIDLPRPRGIEMQGTAVFHKCVTAVRAALEV